MPWIGLRFVETFAGLARDAQLENLQVAARSLAASLHERPELFAARDEAAALPRGVEAIEATPLERGAEGFDALWARAASRQVAVRLEGQAPASTLAVRLALVRLGEAATATVRLLVQAEDERLVPPGDSPGELRVDGRGPVVAPGDSLTIAVGETPAWLRLRDADRRGRAAPVAGEDGAGLPELARRIPVPLEATPGGWRAAIDLPADARLLRVQVEDVDYIGTRRIEARADSGLLLLARVDDTDRVVAAARRQEQRWSEVLRVLERGTGRIAIHDAQGRPLAQRGVLEPAVAPAPDWPSALARALLRLALPPGDPPAATRAPLASALGGVPAQSSTRLAAAAGMPAWQLASAHPVWIDGAVAGALVLEESTAARLALGQSTLERVTLLVLGALLATALALLAIATFVVARIERLRRAAEAAIDARGRVVGTLPAFRLQDEVGSLARSYAGVLARLRDHQQYLARLRSRLVHELRTPIMVVRSSLDNLAADPSPDAALRYGPRAQEGAARLEKLVSSMSEAGSLESMLAESELERIDLRTLAQACLDGYRQAYSAHRWRFAFDGSQAACAVVPDAIAQALDKLAANAADFAPPGTEIVLALAPAVLDRGERPVPVARQAWSLTMTNEGPPLPAAMGESLFESLVSIRADGTHLGLGLYLVRLIAEFHGGGVVATNVAGGVRIGFTVAATGA